MAIRGGLCALVLMVLATLMAATSARAQEGAPEVPVDLDAQLVFEQALQAFNDADYGMAYRRFRLVYTSYPLHRRTTAAILMAGKSLYRQGAYDAARSLLEDFLVNYPTSRYVDEARLLISLSEERASQDEDVTEVFDVGILLPMSQEDLPLTQALFNGVRLAVDEHNQRYGDVWPVRMIFRDSEGTAAGARAAAARLIDEGAKALLGPMYSEEAEAAGDVAEREGIVLLAPLATEEFVSQGRRHVFQANPTWNVRGMMTGRFAVERFGHSRFGVFAEFGDSFSERMAEGFQDEVLRLGAAVQHYRLLEQAANWYGLADQLERASWDSLEAVYLPVSGQDADQLASASLSSLSGAGVFPQVFGSSEWGSVTALSLATSYNTVYTTNFHLIGGEAQERFDERYRQLAGVRPEGQQGRLAYTGYDVTRFLLMRVMQSGDGPLSRAVATAPWYEGIGTRLFFEGENVNRALYYMRYRPGKIDLLR